MTHFIAIIIVDAIIGSIGAGFTHRDLRAGCGGINQNIGWPWLGTVGAFLLPPFTRSRYCSGATAMIFLKAREK